LGIIGWVGEDITLFIWLTSVPGTDVSAVTLTIHQLAKPGQSFFRDDYVERKGSMNFQSGLHTNRTLAFFVIFIVSVLIVILDLVTPQPVMLNFFFLIPVLIAAWYRNLTWAFVCSVALSAVRFLIGVFIEPQWGMQYELINTLDWLIVLCGVSYLTSRLSQSMKRLQLEVGIAEELIPVCSKCKRIRAANQEWVPLEAYISKHAESGLTPGMCPDCVEVLYGEHYSKT